MTPLPQLRFEHGPARIRSPEELHQWIAATLHLRIPRRPVCPNHSAPFEYLLRSYFESTGDTVVWAPRGGGKTRLAAVATLLDLLHKPGCTIRILGGSLQQSLRMWEHLLPDLQKTAPDLPQRSLARSSRAIFLTNRSAVAVLPQSERAVRGLRVQKLRCDEVELFEPHIWQAAQLITKSKPGINATIEAISTFHVRHGLMHKIIEQSAAAKRRILHWCLLEVLEKCPAERDCGTCPLWEDCQGVAKTRCEGFVSIDDAIAMKQRVSKETWECEMLCRRPSTSGSVFPSFDPDLHVKDALPELSGGAAGQISLAIDFGFHAPFVCLWIRDDGACVQVLDEYVQPQRTIADHIEQIESRRWKFKRICCDPAGNGRNDQTAESNVQFLKRRAYTVLSKRSLIVEGLEMIRTALRPGIGEPRLLIHPRCKQLIAAMQGYRYPENGSGELPLKDGEHDHLIDALRYFYVNRRVRSEDQPVPRRY